MNIINNQLICFYFIVSLGFLRMQNNMAFIHILSFSPFFFFFFFFRGEGGGGGGGVGSDKTNGPQSTD